MFQCGPLSSNLFWRRLCCNIHFWLIGTKMLVRISFEVAQGLLCTRLETDKAMAFWFPHPRSCWKEGPEVPAPGEGIFFRRFALEQMTNTQTAHATQKAKKSICSVCEEKQYFVSSHPGKLTVFASYKFTNLQLDFPGMLVNTLGPES